MNARSARWETLVGALAVIAWLVAVIIVEGSGDTGDESAADLLAYFEDQGTQLYIGGMIFFAGSALMIWFGGVLRSLIAAAGLDRLASIAQASSVAVAVTSMGLIAPQMGAGFAAGEDDTPFSPEAAQALWSAGDGFLIAAAISTASLCAAVGLAVLRGKMLPAWLGWLTLVLAVVLLVPYVNWAAIIFAAPLWMLLMTWFLWKSEAGTPAAEPALE
jgi:hypothetical protein